MSARREVNILYYRYAGSFWFLEITQRCEECDITYAILQQLISDVFNDYPVTLQVRPWLDNWHRALLRGAWHAPIVLVNGDHILVQESMDEVVDLSVDYGRKLRTMMPRT